MSKERKQPFIHYNGDFTAGLTGGVCYSELSYTTQPFSLFIHPLSFTVTYTAPLLQLKYFKKNNDTVIVELLIAFQPEDTEME